ncbi:hypothetical protein E2562_024691 [Oryza meyeriana var. granulata]|uniref:Uncharacterized protein n=1 Tax=Oryza meyeriana var. granulata TaxID=110450 RepID=A0A6G1EBL0_9ORYZ|nr:hypothetical protein E2562_024691 [Oryza meyeriana var. granulata]
MKIGWLGDIYVGITEEGETLGSVQQWHAKGPKRARPSKVQHRRHAGAAARESDDDGGNDGDDRDAAGRPRWEEEDATDGNTGLTGSTGLWGRQRQLVGRDNSATTTRATTGDKDDSDSAARTEGGIQQARQLSAWPSRLGDGNGTEQAQNRRRVGGRAGAVRREQQRGGACRRWGGSADSPGCGGGAGE